MNKTNIEYLTHSWSPIAMRCTPISEGCKNCWHLALANRLAKNPLIPKDRQKAYAGGLPVLIEKELNAPLRMKKPAMIGVQFMGDLFHGCVPNGFLNKIFTATNETQHTFLILTKRPKRMQEYIIRKMKLYNYKTIPRNIWLGVTCENQQTADKRIPILLQIPAAVRFVSVEPMLSSVDFSRLPESGAELDWVIVGGESGPSQANAS